MTLILNGDTGLSDVDGSASTPAVRGTDANTGIYFPGADRIGFAEGGVQCGEFDASGNFQFNSGYGSVATAYGYRAWVNFNGTSTVAIRASGNVTSITDNGTGDYTVNFTTALPDANYSGIGMCRFDTGSGVSNMFVNQKRNGTQSSSAFDISTQNASGSFVDADRVFAAFFR